MTIPIINRIVIPNGFFGADIWRFEISPSDQILIESNPNALAANISTFGNVSVNNTIYANSSIPPYGFYWLTTTISGTTYVQFLKRNNNQYFQDINVWNYFDGPYTPAITGQTNFISVTQSPQDLMPGYNPIVFKAFSNKVSEPGYRYLVNVLKDDEIISRLKYVPQPDGSLYADISRILSANLTYDFEQNNFDTGAFNCYANYSVQFGEEYTLEWPYDFAQSRATGTFVGKVELISSGTTHSFIAGDRVQVTTVSSGLTANINGLHTVVEKPANNRIVIDVTYPTSALTINVPGEVVFSDNRKTGFGALTTVSGKTVTNTALDLPTWKDWTGTDYTMFYASPTADKYLLTSMKDLSLQSTNYDKYFLTPMQDIWINFFAEVASDGYHLTVSNDLAQSITTPINDLDPNGNVKQFKIGFNYVELAFGFSTAQTYLDFRVVDPIGDPYSVTYRVYRDNRCPIEPIQVAFLDRYGSILTQSFPLRMTKKINTEKSTYNKQIYYPENGLLDLSLAGETVFHSKVDQEYTINTNWLNDAQMALYEEMLTSAATWIKFEDDGPFLPCIIQNKTEDITRQANKILFQKTATVKLANGRPINI